jgi:hypothetical protein
MSSPLQNDSSFTLAFTLERLDRHFMKKWYTPKIQSSPIQSDRIGSFFLEIMTRFQGHEKQVNCMTVTSWMLADDGTSM